MMDSPEIADGLTAVWIGGRKGENWRLEDQPTAGVLLQSESRGHFHMEKAPFIGENLEYSPGPEGKEM